MFPDQFNFMDSFDEDLDVAFGLEFQNYLSQASNSSSSSTVINIPTGSSITSWYNSPMDLDQAKQYITENYTQFTDMNNVDENSIQKFGNLNPSENLTQVNPFTSTVETAIEVHNDPYVISEEAPANLAQPTKKRSRTRPPSQTYDHIIAERRRREQLSQLFVALSALIPGLKKMDKSSVLEDAIKYMKDLKERVKNLEDQAEKRSMESVVIVKRSQIIVEDEGHTDEQSECIEEQPLPEIEARVCDTHILISVLCEKKKGVLVNLLSKIESLDMIVVNTNATSFGNVALDITIIAELEKGFNLTAKEVVTVLRGILRAGCLNGKVDVQF